MLIFLPRSDSETTVTTWSPLLIFLPCSDSETTETTWSPLLISLPGSDSETTGTTWSPLLIFLPRSDSEPSFSHFEVFHLPKGIENQSGWAGEKPEDKHDETKLFQVRSIQQSLSLNNSQWVILAAPMNILAAPMNIFNKMGR